VLFVISYRNISSFLSLRLPNLNKNIKIFPWSDPDDVEAWQTSPRGAGYLFGESQTSEFLQLNNLDLIARAHQLANDGLRWHFNEKLVTVWSAPNYCYRCNNLAATLTIKSDGSRDSKYFQAVPNHQRVIPPKTITPYFL